MPTPLHELMVELLRTQPHLLLALLRGAETIDVRELDLRHPRLLDATLPDWVPPARVCDLVLELRRRGARSPDDTIIVIVEIQLERDVEKGLTWPLYCAILRARAAGNEVWLVVLTPHAATERWASEVLVEVLPPVVRWAVLGPASTSRVTEPARARRDPHAAVLSALIHAGRDDADLVPAIASAYSTMSPRRGIVIHELMARRLSRMALRVLEHEMEKKTLEWTSPYARRHRAKALAEGRAEGLAEGRAEGAQHMLISLLTQRGLRPTRAQLAEIRRCPDLRRLARWLARASAADTAAEVFSPTRAHARSNRRSASATGRISGSSTRRRRGR